MCVGVVFTTPTHYFLTKEHLTMITKQENQEKKDSLPTFKCNKCSGKYELISGFLGCCTAEANYRTSGICGGELIKI